MDLYFNFGSIISALAFLVLGLIIYAVVFKSVSKTIRTMFREDILEKQNIALAILIGLVSLSVSIIIAAAVH